MSRDASEASPVGRSAELDLTHEHIAAAGQVLVTGEPGVGKSTFLDACARRLGADGFVVLSVAGTAALVDHPLAALGHLIGDPGDRTGPALSSFAVARLGELVRGSKAVVIVDDAHAVDTWSLHAIARARAADGPRVLMGARSSGLNDAVATFGRFPGLRLELQRLSADETAVLAAEVLGGPLDTPSAVRIHQATDGLPLAIVELLRHARRRGALIERSGLYRWDPSVALDRHLAALLGLRVDDLDPVARDVVDAVTVLGEVPDRIVRRLAPTADLAALEEQRLVRAAPRPGWITIGHPLLRDAAAALLGDVGRTELIRRLVDALVGERDAELVRLRVVLAVEIEAEVDGDDLMEAARWARAHGLWKSMMPVMARAWTELPNPSSGLAYGEALYWARQMVESERVLREAAVVCHTDGDRVAVATARARTLDIGLGRSAEADALRTSQLAGLHDPAHRLEVQCAQAERWLFDGAVQPILDVWESTREPSSAGDQAWWAARYRLTQTTVGALGLRGRLTEMAQEYEVHLHLAEHHAPAHPLGREVTDPWWVAGNLMGGELPAVHDLLADRYAAALSVEDGLLRPLWALPRAIEEWLGGDLEAAEHFAREAMGVPVEVVSIRRMATHFLARVLADGGRWDEALVHAGNTAGDDYVGVVRTWSVGLEHRCRAATGRLVTPADLARSVDAVTSAVENAVAQGQFVPAAFIAHDLAGSGQESLVIDVLRELAAATDAATVQWMWVHVDALVHGDVGALVDVARSALDAGCDGLAVVLAQDALTLATERRHRAAADDAESVLQRCVTTGIPRRREAGVMVAFGLSPREQEIARAAAAGLTDQEIATAFFISVRTVNAHLRAVYRKLDIAGRRELQTSLRATVPTK